MKYSDFIEGLPVEEIKRIQDRLLEEAVTYAWKHSPYYMRVFRERGITPSDIRGVDNISILPLTQKENIQEDNWAFLSVPREEIAEIVSTTGTTGDPTFVALTAGDLERLACNEERSFGYACAVPEDLFHISVTCDNLFIAGIAYYRGLIKLGASVVRIGPQNIIRHLDLIRKLRPTGIVAVPSFMVQLARRVSSNGVSAAELGIRKIVLIGDSIRDEDFRTNALGTLIENAFGNVCFSTYGITEAQQSFCECSIRQGLHSHPDFAFAEIIDEEGFPLPDGEMGELVLTPFGIEGMPLLRYRTGDMTFKISGPCACGRNSVRLGPILGRRNQKLKFKGVTLYPKNIENALLCVKGVINYQIEAFTGDDETDNIILRVGYHGNGEDFRAELCEMIKAKARVTPKVEVEHPEQVDKRLYEGGSRKAMTFMDRRVKRYG
jgi:phenylacetate-CoA ligase